MKFLLENGAAIDVAYLFLKFPDLAALEKRGLGLDEIGDSLGRRVRDAASKQMKSRRPREAGAAHAESDWTAAKDVLREVLCTGSPEFHEIRQRLRDQAGAVTPHLLATLSLWLAGFLGISVTTVTPLVATVLLGIARNGLDGWCASAEELEA